MADRPTDALSAVYKPLHPALMSCSFQRNDFNERDKDTPKKKFVNGTVRVHARDETGYVLGSCEFEAGEEPESPEENSESSQENKPPFFEVKAEFVVAIQIRKGAKLSNKELTEIFTAVAGTSAWPLFRSYFASVTALALSELPALPVIPDFIDTYLGGSGD